MKLRPEASDNHWLDCLVGCAVAASMQGAVLPGTGGSGQQMRQKKQLDLGAYPRQSINVGGDKKRKILDPSAPRRRLL